MKQIYDMPIIYDAEVIPKGCRKSHMKQISEDVPFEIETLSTDKAPLLLVLQNQYNDVEYIRKIDDDFLYPIGSSAILHDDHSNLPEDLMPFKEQIDTDQNIFISDFDKNIEPGRRHSTTQELFKKFYQAYSDSKLISPDDNFKLISDNKQNVINGIQEILNNVVIIDGGFYKKSKQEPYLKIDYTNNHEIKNIGLSTYTSDYDFDSVLIPYSRKDCIREFPEFFNVLYEKPYSCEIDEHHIVESIKKKIIGDLDYASSIFPILDDRKNEKYSALYKENLVDTIKSKLASETMTLDTLYSLKEDVQNLSLIVRMQHSKKCENILEKLKSSNRFYFDLDIILDGDNYIDKLGAMVETVLNNDNTLKFG